MRLVLRYIIFTGIAFVAPSIFLSALAQERCGTVQYSKTLHADYALRKVEFEQWISRHRLRQQSTPDGRRQTTHYQIPVVVHVIHNGEEIGQGANISDAQVLSQMRVLNDDFNRQNADAANTPAVFAAVAGSLDIEFVLAKQDPDGQHTNGIVRVDGNRNGWTINDNYTLKQLSYWPAEQYMNIWVCNLTDQFLGYAQTPESDLQGMENSSTNRKTDGVVVTHQAFGSVDDGAFNLDPVFNKGRTATHEIGHFLGLNHIWGDDAGCNGSDYVNDTPNQGNRTQGCPSHPKTDNCGEVIMFQNFLDYTDDRCMNLFTQGQVDRMTVVLENSPRRHSLLASPGLQEPDPLPNDIGIRTILFPDATVCSNSVTPLIEVRNYGNNTITSTRIRFTLDGDPHETKDFALSLGPQQSSQVAFSPLTMPSGAHDISFEVLLTNGGADSGGYNDVNSATVIVPVFASVPFEETFSTVPSGWITENPDGQITWETATAPRDVSTNKALKLNYFDYEDKIGEVDIFLSPVLDLSAVPAAALTFDVAYARYQSSNDRLKVIVLTDCGEIAEGNEVFNKAGDALKTAPATTSPFIPTNETQWRKELIDLTSFLGMSKVQLAFVGINDWGNNIYVDNITFITELRRDVALVRVTPFAVTCDNPVTPKVIMRNTGNVLLNSLTVEYSLNSGPVQSLELDHLDIPYGEEKEVALPLTALEEGENTLSVTLKDPNGQSDVNPSDNSQSFVIVVNNEHDRIPLRQNFDEGLTSAWTTVNPRGGMKWEITPTNFGQSLYFNAYNNESAGDEAWLVSPVLDLSATTQAGMLFDLSSARRGDAAEILTILASTDCGMTYQEVSYNFPGVAASGTSWSPVSEGDWRRNISVNLNSIAGSENARIAFVVRNQNGNNLYLDNIEFFVTANPNPIEIAELYSIYGYNFGHSESSELRITFNLPVRQDVRFSLISVTGQMETDGLLTDVLNQTYPLTSFRKLAPGVYFVRLQIGGKFYTSRIMVF